MGIGDGTYVPAVAWMRTPAERSDQQRSWERSDEAFFASGACHVLAFRLLERHPDEGWSAVLLRPGDGRPGAHVYVSAGGWAFDFNGWTEERVLLSVTAQECRRRWQGWSCERLVVDGTLEDFCRTRGHRLPSQFAHDPIPRADAFLDRLPAHPPGPRSA